MLGARQITLTLSCALLEAPGFAAVIAYLLEGQPVALLVVLASAVAIAMQIPTRERLRGWLEHHLALIAELRQLGF